MPCERTDDTCLGGGAADGLRKEDSLAVKVRALLAERRQQIGYERVLVAAVQSCQCSARLAAGPCVRPVLSRRFGLRTEVFACPLI